MGRAAGVKPLVRNRADPRACGRLNPRHSRSEPTQTFQISGFSLACYNIFLLPLDVANQHGQFGSSAGLPMKEISIAFFGATTVMCLVVVPFTVFYYEGEDDSDIADGSSRWVKLS